MMVVRIDEVKANVELPARACTHAAPLVPRPARRPCTAGSTRDAAACAADPLRPSAWRSSQDRHLTHMIQMRGILCMLTIARSKVLFSASTLGWLGASPRTASSRSDR